MLLNGVFSDGQNRKRYTWETDWKRQNCCRGPSIASIRKIKIEDKDMEIAGLDEEFENYYSEGKTPENLDGEEIIRNLEKINVIPEEEVEKLKAAILKEYRIYWLEKEE